MIVPEIKTGYVKGDSLTSSPYAYAELELFNGETLRMVMSHEELSARAKRSKGSLWDTDFETMAKSTVRSAFLKRYAGAVWALFAEKNGMYDFKFPIRDHVFIGAKPIKKRQVM